MVESQKSMMCDLICERVPYSAGCIEVHFPSVCHIIAILNYMSVSRDLQACKGNKATNKNPLVKFALFMAFRVVHNLTEQTQDDRLQGSIIHEMIYLTLPKVMATVCSEQNQYWLFMHACPSHIHLMEFCWSLHQRRQLY